MRITWTFCWVVLVGCWLLLAFFHAIVTTSIISSYYMLKNKFVGFWMSSMGEMYKWIKCLLPKFNFWIRSPEVYCFWMKFWNFLRCSIYSLISNSINVNWNALEWRNDCCISANFSFFNYCFAWINKFSVKYDT